MKSFEASETETAFTASWNPTLCSIKNCISVVIKLHSTTSKLPVQALFRPHMLIKYDVMFRYKLFSLTSVPCSQHERHCVLIECIQYDFLYLPISTGSPA